MHRLLCRPWSFWFVLVALVISIVNFGIPVRADEGLWLFNKPPRQLLKDRYGFDLSDQWLNQVQRSVVRFNSGGTGSFVSADGLVITNHHVGSESIEKLSSAANNMISNGFLARTPAEELKCLDLELNVLMDIEDVTDRVNAAIKPGMDSAAANKARRAVINGIEKESFEKTGLRSDVVTLYKGGVYNLYRYKKYTDVRLVFAPEKDIAVFGGDPDNFEYPRYCLDVCFFRVYEDGIPIRPLHHLTWSKVGLAEDELIFLTGYPGSTHRLNTMAHLEFYRDRDYPQELNLIRRQEVLLKTYSDHGLENARRAQDELWMAENSRKAELGGLASLQDPAIMEAKRKAEKRLRNAVNVDPKLCEVRHAWNQVTAAMVAWDQIYDDYHLYETGDAFNSKLFNIARMLIRLSEESTKPNADRLEEYAEAGLDSLKLQLFSEAPIYPDFEIAKLSDSLGYLMERAGARNPLVKQIFANQSPAQRASDLVLGTKLADVKVRRQLAAGGQSAIKASEDPMIALARLVDGPSRHVRKLYENKVKEPLRQAYAKITKAHFAIGGEGAYPDGTFTLRLAFGQVKGYEESGKRLPPWTTIGGAYEHAAEHDNVSPFNLPDRWVKDKDKLDLETPLNFVNTAEMIGGNSGSPIINRAGEFVGIAFDGNIHGLALEFVYTDKQARAIAVHSAGIVEALQKLYGASELVAELGAKKWESGSIRGDQKISISR